MSASPNAVPQTQPGSPMRTLALRISFRPLYWSIRRELWENRSIYLGPMAAAVVFLGGFAVKLITYRSTMHGNPNLPPDYKGLLVPFEFAALLIMGTAFIVGVFYALDCLYGERRDRSILFWKSLPVSDLTTVLSKVSVPVVILPLLSFAITIVTQLLMVLVSSLVISGSGNGTNVLWEHASFLHVSGMLFYHLVTVHGLWYAPIYGWLILVSASAPRAPFIWAFLPPFVICGVEKIAFNTTYCLSILLYRVTGPDVANAGATDNLMDVVSSITPRQFFSQPGLWTGLALAIVFIAFAIRLRRYRGSM